MREGFTGTLKAKCPPSLPPLIERAAGAKMMTASEYTRRAVIAQLEADGLMVPRRQWALVSGDRVLTMTHIDGQPQAPDIADEAYWPADFSPADGDRWVPVENEDTQSFDVKIHYRLAPHFRVEADRAVRVYPVVAKAEYA